MAKIFPYLYFVLILSVYLIGQLEIPGLPFNVLQTITLATLFSCILIDKKILWDKNVGIYFAFLVFYFLSSVLSGDGLSYIKFITSTIIISYAGYWGTKVLLSESHSLTPLILSLTIIGILDVIVTIAQALGLPIATSLVFLLQNQDNMQVVVNTGYELGSAVSGFFLNPVFNGHALLFCFVISLLLLKSRFKLIGITSAICILGGLFYCQQRSAFFLCLLVVVFLSLKYMRNNAKLKILIIFVTLVAIFYVVPKLVDYVDDTGSRILDTSSTHRDVIWKAALGYLSDNLIFGGFFDFCRITGYYPHNFILSSFLCGGLVGGFALLYLIFSKVKQAISNYVTLSNSNYSALIASFLFIALTADSFLHNTGMADGDFAVFVALALLTYSSELNEG